MPSIEPPGLRFAALKKMPRPTSPAVRGLLIWIADPHDPACAAPVLTTHVGRKAHTAKCSAESWLAKAGPRAQVSSVVPVGADRWGSAVLNSIGGGVGRVAGRGIAEGVAGARAFPRDSLVGVEAHRAGAAAGPTGRMARISRGISLGGAPPKPLSGPREDMVGGVLPWRSTGDRLAMGRPAR
jgi:hypothetical protein